MSTLAALLTAYIAPTDNQKIIISTILKTCRKNQRFSTISPQQLATLGTLFQLRLISTQKLLALANSPGFNYQNLSRNIDIKTWKNILLLPGAAEFVFTTAPPSHIFRAISALLQMPLLKSLLIHRQLKMAHLIYYVARIAQHAYESDRDYAKKIVAPFVELSSNALKFRYIYQQILIEMCSSRLFQNQPNGVELLLLATQPDILLFCSQNIFDIAELNYFMLNHLDNIAFIREKFNLLKMVYQKASHLPSIIKNSSLPELWNTNDRQIITILDNIKKIQHKDIKKVLEKFSCELNADSIYHLKDYPGLFTQFLMLLQEDNWDGLFNAHDVDMNQFFLTRDKDDLAEFFAVLTMPDPDIQELYLAGKICNELLIYSSPKQIKYLINHDKANDSDYIKTIYKNACDEIAKLSSDLAIDFILKHKIVREKFSKTLKAQLPIQAKQEQQAFIAHVQQGNATINSPVTSTHTAKKKNVLQTASDHLVFPKFTFSASTD